MKKIIPDGPEAIINVADSLAEMTQQSMFVLIRVDLQRQAHRATKRKVHAELITQIHGEYVLAECDLSDVDGEQVHGRVNGPFCTNGERARAFFGDWLGDLTTMTLEQRFDLGDPTSAVRVIVEDNSGFQPKFEDAGHRAFSDLDVFYGALLGNKPRHLTGDKPGVFFRRLNGLRTCHRKKMERLQEAVNALHT